MKILYVNACVREESRTRMLAEHFIDELKKKYASGRAVSVAASDKNVASDRTSVIKREPAEKIVIDEVVLEKEGIEPLSRAGLEARNEAVAKGDYSDSLYDNARKLLQADLLLVAAPHWDLSFPAYVKLFFESVTIDGLTFHYTEEGFPEGFSNAEKMVYITTAGGPVVSDEYGFGYLRDLSKFYYGIPESVQFKAENLDVIGADVDGILEGIKKEIDDYISGNL